MLMAIAGISAGIADPGGEPVIAASFVVIGEISAACGVGLFGGVMNIVNVLAERDPLWMRLRGVFGRR